MAEYDGNIRIGIDFGTKAVSESLKDLSKNLDAVRNRLKVLDSDFKKSSNNDTFDNQKKNFDEIRASLVLLAKEYQALNDVIQKSGSSWGSNQVLDGMAKSYKLQFSRIMRDVLEFKAQLKAQLGDAFINDEYNVGYILDEEKFDKFVSDLTNSLSKAADKAGKEFNIKPDIDLSSVRSELDDRFNESKSSYRVIAESLGFSDLGADIKRDFVGNLQNTASDISKIQNELNGLRGNIKNTYDSNTFVEQRKRIQELAEEIPNLQNRFIQLFGVVSQLYDGKLPSSVRHIASIFTEMSNTASKSISQIKTAIDTNLNSDELREANYFVDDIFDDGFYFDYDDNKVRRLVNDLQRDLDSAELNVQVDLDSIELGAKSVEAGNVLSVIRANAERISNSIPKFSGSLRSDTFSSANSSAQYEMSNAEALAQLNREQLEAIKKYNEARRKGVDITKALTQDEIALTRSYYEGLKVEERRNQERAKQQRNEKFNAKVDSVVASTVIDLHKEESKIERLHRIAEEVKIDFANEAEISQVKAKFDELKRLASEIKIEVSYNNNLSDISNKLEVLRKAAENIRLNVDSGATENVVSDITAVRTELNKLKEKREELNARLEDGTISRVQFLADTARVDRAINELENELVDIEVNIDAEDIENLEEDLESISFGDLVNADLLADAIRELTSALRDLGKASLESGANFQSSYLRIKDTFGEASESIYAYAQSSKELLGMSETAFMQSAEYIGVFAKEYIKDTDKLASVTAGMTTAIADLSAQTGFSIDDTMEKVLSGLRGNTEAIEELSINVKVADMQTWLDTKGIDAKFENLNSEMQNLYRTWYMLEKVASNGAIGYSAKMMETYSGQVRILKANFEELKTTMGTYLMQALVPVIKIINVLLSRLVDLANVIGEVFGLKDKYTLATDISVSTPNVDTSVYDNSLSDIEESVNSLADAQGNVTDEVNKTAKAAKKALAPFHKLNILQNNDSGSGSKSKKPSVSVPDIGSALSSISGAAKEWVSPLEKFMDRLSKNKLSEKILKIKESISSFIKALKDLSPLLKGIATAIGVFIGAKVLGGLVKKLLALKGVAKVIGIVSSTLGVFKTALASGAGIFKSAGLAIGSLWESFKAFMKGLSPLAKTVVTIASLAATFVTFKDAIKNLTLSSYIKETGEFSLTWDNLKTALANIIPMFSIAGTAMYAMFGQIGLIATAVVGLVAALAGYDAALQELTNRRVDEIFSNGTLSIQDYTNAILESNTGMLALVDTLNNTTETLSSNAEQLPAITSEIDFLAGKIGFLGDESGELKTQMDEALGNLANLAKEQVEVLSKSIADTLTPEMENLAIQAGLTKDEINELLYGVDATTQSNIDRATEELKALHGVAEADRTPEQTARIEELTSWLGEAANGLSEYSTKWQSSINEINSTSLNFKDAKEGIEYFQDSMAQLLGDVEGAKLDVLTQYDEKIRQIAKDPYLSEEEKKAQIDNINILKAAADLGFEEEINNIKEQIGAGAGKIGLEYTKKFSEAVEQEMDALTETGWWTGVQLKAFQTNEGAIDELYNKAYENVSKAFEEKTGYTPQGIIDWVDSWYADPTVPATNVVDSFESKLNSYGETKDFYGNIITSGAESAKQLAWSTGESIGNNTSDGLANGIDENAYKAEEASEDMAKGVESAARDALDTHSPSVVFSEIGYDVDNGLAGGITCNKNVPVNAMSGLVTDLVNTGSDTDKFKSIGSSITSSINDGLVEKAPSLLETIKGIFNDMADLGDKFLSNFGSTISTASSKLAGVETPDNLANVATTISNLHIPKLANGAVIKPNQRFLAELGDQTRGVNIETPLNTMLDAFRGALSESSYGSGGDITIPVYIGGELLDEVVVNANNRDTYRNNGR